MHKFCTRLFVLELNNLFAVESISGPDRSKRRVEKQQKCERLEDYINTRCERTKMCKKQSRIAKRCVSKKSKRQKKCKKRLSDLISRCRKQRDKRRKQCDQKKKHFQRKCSENDKKKRKNKKKKRKRKP